MFANYVVVLLLILVAVISWSLSQMRYANKLAWINYNHETEVAQANSNAFESGWTAGLEQGKRSESLRRMSSADIDTVFDQEK